MLLLRLYIYFEKDRSGSNVSNDTHGEVKTFLEKTVTLLCTFILLCDVSDRLLFVVLVMIPNFKFEIIFRVHNTFCSSAHSVTIPDFKSEIVYTWPVYYSFLFLSSTILDFKTEMVILLFPFSNLRMISIFIKDVSVSFSGVGWVYFIPEHHVLKKLILGLARLTHKRQHWIHSYYSFYCSPMDQILSRKTHL